MGQWWGLCCCRGAQRRARWGICARAAYTGCGCARKTERASARTRYRQMCAHRRTSRSRRRRRTLSQPRPTPCQSPGTPLTTTAALASPPTGWSSAEVRACLHLHTYLCVPISCIAYKNSVLPGVYAQCGHMYMHAVGGNSN